MVGLLDCNNFYVSCERVFQPRLEGKPVIVLSNNDGCIVSRSAEAKALGIRMGAPYFQVKEHLQQHQVQVFSSNYALYGDMSRRVMWYLAHVTPGVEVYSVDEAFLDLGGLERYMRSYLGGGLEAFAHTVRANVKARTGLPTCVGVAPTRTLAKLANHLAKQLPDLGGVLYLDTPQRRAWALGQVAASDVWGIGRQYAQKLTGAGIDSAADLAQVSEAWARKHLGGVVGARLVRELQGLPCAGPHLSEQEEAGRHSITCSRTFGRHLTAFADLLAAVTTFVVRAAEKLRAQGDQAHLLTVYVQTNRYDPRVPPPHTHSATLTLPTGPTADTLLLTGYARHLLRQLWKSGAAYRKAGVVLDGLEPPGQGQQLGLFETAADEAATSAPSRPQLMVTLDALNARFGRGMVRPASAVTTASVGQPPPWQGLAQWRSGAFTTRLEDLLTVS